MNVLSTERFFAALAWAVLVAMGPASSAAASLLTGPVLNPANGHSYYLLEKATWFDSQAEALTLSGNLATINDDAENNWVYSTFSTFGGVNRGLWIGFTDAAVEGTWVWVSGEPVTYTHWDVGEPNSANPNEDYAHLESPVFQGPAWNDRDGNDFTVGSGRWGVVEVVPEPTTLALFVCGLVVFYILASRPGRGSGSAARAKKPSRGSSATG